MRHPLTYPALALLGISIGATGLIGCEGEETAQYPPQPYPTATTPMPAPTQVQPQPQQPTGGQATALPPVMGLGVAPVLKGTAEKETAGMSPDGQSVVASFMQGQYHEMDFQLQPGRCYTVVGVGMGVHELDIQVITNQPPAPAATLAQDDRTGPHSVVGGAGRCHQSQSPIPLAVKIRTTATTGSGIVMVQVYSK